jgi:hypothetical protein
MTALLARIVPFWNPFQPMAIALVHRGGDSGQEQICRFICRSRHLDCLLLAIITAIFRVQNQHLPDCENV